MTNAWLLDIAGHSQPCLNRNLIYHTLLIISILSLVVCKKGSRAASNRSNPRETSCWVWRHMNFGEFHPCRQDQRVGKVCCGDAWWADTVQDGAPPVINCFIKPHEYYGSGIPTINHRWAMLSHLSGNWTLANGGAPSCIVTDDFEETERRRFFIAMSWLN